MFFLETENAWFVLVCDLFLENSCHRCSAPVRAEVSIAIRHTFSLESSDPYVLLFCIELYYFHFLFEEQLIFEYKDKSNFLIEISLWRVLSQTLIQHLSLMRWRPAYLRCRKCQVKGTNSFLRPWETDGSWTVSVLSRALVYFSNRSTANGAYLS